MKIKMKKQITVLVTYKSGSRHLVCFNEIDKYPAYLGTTIFISGYIIDSETLPIGTAMSQKIIELNCVGLLERRVYHGLCWCIEIEVIEAEYYSNWLDNLFHGDKGNSMEV